MGSARLRVGAFFDVDKTIISENSANMFFKELYERGEIDTWQVLAGLGSYLRYKLNLLDIERWTERNLQIFAGRNEQALAREVEGMVREQLIPVIYPEADRLVRQHIEDAHLGALV